MTREENIRAILESIFSGFKEELIDIATKNICDLETEPCDCVSRVEVLEQINCWIGSGEYRNTNATWYLGNRMKALPSVRPEQEPKTDYKAFAKWVAREIFSENWEYNKESFAEIACRKLGKLGMVVRMGDVWELVESEGANDTDK